MTIRRKPRTMVAAAPQPEVKRDPRLDIPPLWDVPRRGLTCSASTYTLSMLSRRTFWLPPYQRPAVWTPEMQLKLTVDRWNGAPMAPIVIWSDERRGGRAWLLDGQQRCIALGLDVRDHLGVRREPPPTRLDWMTGRWSISDGDPMSIVKLVQTRDRLLRDNSLFETPGLWSTFANAVGHAERITVDVVLYAMYEHPFTSDDLAAAFAAYATPGVPWTPEDIKRTVESVMDWTPQPEQEFGRDA